MTLLVFCFVGLISRGLDLSIAGESTPQPESDPEIQKALKDAERQRQIIDGTRPVCLACETGPSPPAAPYFPPRDDCWDDTAVHQYIMNSDFKAMGSPDIVSRKNWSKLQGSAKPYSVQRFSGKGKRRKWVGQTPTNPTPLIQPGQPGPRAIVIHHTAAPESQTINGIQNFHQKVRGYKDIAYHFLIGFDPEKKEWVIYEGRQKAVIGKGKTAKEVLAYAAHAENANNGTIGICLIGDYDDIYAKDELPPAVEGQKRPPAQAVSLLGQLVGSLMEKYPTIKEITGHASGYHFASPGTASYKPKALKAGTGIGSLGAGNAALQPQKTNGIYEITEEAEIEELDDGRHSDCPGRYMYQVVESLRMKYSSSLRPMTGFFISNDVKIGKPGPACDTQMQSIVPSVVPPSDEKLTSGEEKK